MLEGRTTFFVLYTLILLVAIYFLTQIEHGEETLYFSNRHTPFWDNFFVFCTRLGEPYAYGVFIIIFLFVRYGYSILIPLIGIVVAILQWGLKMLFLEKRPFNFFKDRGMLEMLNFVPDVRVFQDATSFPSGHTMSAFAIYGFMAFAFGHKPIWQVFYLTLAVLVGISRMYLLQHFLNDVVSGSLVGVYLAMFFYACHIRYRSVESWMSKKLRIK